MPTSWSNPNPSDNTAAALGAHAMVQAPNISGVISAILEDRYRKQQQYQQTLEQVGKVVGDYQHQNSSRQLADFIAGQSDFVNSDQADQISNLPPDAQLAAINALRQQHEEGDKQTQQDLLNRIRQDEEARRIYETTHKPQIGDTPQTYTDNTGTKYVLGPRGWQAIRGSALTAGQDAVEQRFKERQAATGLDEQIAGLNTAGQLSTKPVAGQPPGYQIDRYALSNPNTTFKDFGPGNEPIPPGYYGVGISHRGGKPSAETIVPADQFDKAHSALDAYNKLISTPAIDPATLQNSQQDNTASGAQQSSGGYGPKLWEPGTIDGQPVIWDGRGWKPRK